MSTGPIIQALNNMAKLHRSLMALAKQKTEIIKKGDISSLQNLLKEENKHIQVIKKLENNLVSEAKTFLQKQGVELEQPTMANVIEMASEAEKEAIEKEKAELQHSIEELRTQNELNQQLLEQSLQFVNVSLDLLQPDLDSYNYDPSENTQSERQPNRSLFDSKA